MKGIKGTFTSMSVNELEDVREFYEKKLGCKVIKDASPYMLMFDGGGGTKFSVYPKGDEHQAANHTVLNFDVDDIEEAIDDLVSKGVEMSKEPNTDSKGISTQGPAKVAWLKDPCGNYIAITQNVA